MAIRTMEIRYLAHVQIKKHTSNYDWEHTHWEQTTLYRFFLREWKVGFSQGSNVANNFHITTSILCLFLTELLASLYKTSCRIYMWWKSIQSLAHIISNGQIRLKDSTYIFINFVNASKKNTNALWFLYLFLRKKCEIGKIVSFEISVTCFGPKPLALRQGNNISVEFIMRETF